MDTRDYATQIGKDFTSEVELDVYITKKGHKASVSIGKDYYESDPYKAKDLALCEVKGFLEGVKAKIEGVLQSIEREINEQLESRNAKK
jgi:PHD/YefM family antitoxin component YafN of YafNO toxin-antitoxin module